MGSNGVKHYLFNLVRTNDGPSQHELASKLLSVGMWGIAADEGHGEALGSGDLILIYLGAPERVFVGRAELESAVHDWTPSEAGVSPDESPRGVRLTRVEVWEPAVPMSAVLSRIGPSEAAKADFHTGVLQITAYEYECATAEATGTPYPPCC